MYPSSKSISIDKLFHESNEKSDLLINEETDGKKCPQKTLRTERFHEEIERINHHFSSYEDLPIKKAVFIDSTWSQSKGIYKDERLKCLPTLVIQNRVSQFWRYQRGSPRWYLATVEAVHQFLLEVHMNAWGVHPDYKGPNAEKYLIVEKCETSPEIKPYCGQYDNILIFFCHMYNKIHSLYDHEQLKAYKRLMSWLLWNFIQ